VLDSDYSIVWDEAENRKTAMRAIFVYLLNPDLKYASEAVAKKYNAEIASTVPTEVYKRNV
ncbi:putrescine carbamoyltransferase, partial [Levilactobacillus zymae]